MLWVTNWCGTVWPFVVLVVCERRSENLFVCFGAKPTQRTEDEISHETGNVGWKEGPREDKESVDKGTRRDAVDNEEQKRPVGVR